MFNYQTILITGGTGSWGQELTTQLLQKYNPKKIIIFSRGELAQVLMQRKFNDPRISYIIGDIRDLDALTRACKGVDYIFHLAALKHVPVCEYHPQEAIKTNIQGTQNIINAAIDNHVKKVIDVSTDKAVDPLNLYGMTKAVGERLIVQANMLSDTKFVCIRGGNVIGSNGSVIPFFIDQIKKQNEVTITDLNMTRYFMSLSDAISLLFAAAIQSYGGETFVMKMPSYYIEDIAKKLISVYGDDDTKIKQIGIRPGEKIDEVLVSSNEAKSAYYFNEDYIVIMPTINIDYIFEKYSSYTKFHLPEFTSKTFVTRDTELVNKMLKGSKFI